MKHLISIYFLSIKNDMISQLSYKKDFLLQMVIWSLYTFLPFLSIVMLIEKFGPIGIYNVHQIAILYGIITISYDFARMIARGFDNFSQLLISGDFDIFYIRPQPILLQIFGSSIFLRRLAGIMQGVAILVWGSLPYHMNTTFLVAFLFVIVETIILYVALFILYSGICFYTIKDNLFSDLIDTSVSVGYYPIEYIRKPLRFIFTFIVPIATCVYYPLKPILTNAKLYGYNLFIAMLCSSLMLVFAIGFFQFSKRYYKSVNN